MKALSLISLILAVLLAASEYAEFYCYGTLHPWGAFDLLMPLFVVLVLFPTLVIACMISFVCRRNRVWTSAILIGFIGVVVLVRMDAFRPEQLQVYGIHDRVMKAFTLEDLRQFAKSIHQEVPYIMILHDDGTSLTADRVDAYRKLQRRYAFLLWSLGPGHDAIVQDQDGVVTVQWGSPLMGHFGFSISTDNAKNDPVLIDPRNVIRASDDIYFFGWR